MGSQSVYQEFLYAASKYGGKPFLHIPAGVYGAAQANEYTYSETLSRTQELVDVYQTTGLSVGSRVAILLENRLEFFLHWFALNSLGVCVVPVNGELQVDEICYLLDNSDTCLAISLESKRQLLDDAVAQLHSQTGKSIPVVVHDQLAGTLVQSSASQTQANTSVEISQASECAMLYTSGSTGKPKGCILSNSYFLASGEYYRDAGGYIALQKGVERLITPLPLVHMNAMAMSTLGMIMTGGCVIQLDRFHPRSWWQTVRDSGATVIHYLGVMPAILLNIESDQDEDFSRQVKFGFGAGVNPKHHAVFEQRFGFPLIESWGMTETGGGNCITANHDPRHVGSSCIGKKPDYLDIKLVDESGAEVAAGDPGELLVRSSSDDPKRAFFSGYHKNPQATAETWEGGWLHTGDILRQGDDGSYHFVDRLKNVIRRSGENISALEVEANLSLNPSIGQVAVTPVPDEIRGDEVFACVILDEGVEPNVATAEAIFERSADALVYYKLPGYIAFVDEFPLTASNKPQRAELKTMARQMVDNIDRHDTCFDLRSSKRKR